MSLAARSPLQASAMDARHFAWPLGDAPANDDLAEAFPILPDFALDAAGGTLLIAHACALLEELHRRGPGPATATAADY